MQRSEYAKRQELLNEPSNQVAQGAAIPVRRYIDSRMFRILAAVQTFTSPGLPHLNPRCSLSRAVFADRLASAQYIFDCET